MGINRLLSIIPSPDDFNIKLSATVLDYIMNTEDALSHVKTMLTSRTTDQILHTPAPGRYIKELVTESISLVESDDIPLYYNILNCAMEIIDYDWIARTIYFSLYPEKLEEIERIK